MSRARAILESQIYLKVISRADAVTLASEKKLVYVVDGDYGIGDRIPNTRSLPTADHVALIYPFISYKSVRDNISSTNHEMIIDKMLELANKHGGFKSPRFVCNASDYNPWDSGSTDNPTITRK